MCTSQMPGSILQTQIDKGTLYFSLPYLLWDFWMVPLHFQGFQNSLSIFFQYSDPRCLALFLREALALRSSTLKPSPDLRLLRGSHPSSQCSQLAEAPMPRQTAVQFQQGPNLGDLGGAFCPPSARPVQSFRFRSRDRDSPSSRPLCCQTVAAGTSFETARH